MSGNKTSNNNSNRIQSVSTPRPIGVAPSRETRAGERPSYQAPTPPKTK